MIITMNKSCNWIVIVLAHTVFLCEGLRIYEACTSHSDCPSNSKCRPSACDGYTCRCDNMYVSSDDRQTCVKATRIGGPCIFGQSKCISPFSMCIGTCQCFSVFKPTQDGRCKLPDVSFVDENCGRTKCEFPAVCNNGMCVCKSPYRKLTEEEFWLDPLNPVQCKPEDYSLDMCNGTRIPVPYKLLPTTTSVENEVTTTFQPTTTIDETTTQRLTTSTTLPTTPTLPSTTTSNPTTTATIKSTTSTLPKTTTTLKTTTTPTTTTTLPSTTTTQKITTTVEITTQSKTTTTTQTTSTTRSTPTTTTATTSTISPQTPTINKPTTESSTKSPRSTTSTPSLIIPTSEYIKRISDIFRTCSSDIECPEHSRCRPNGCNGYNCLCNEGFIASDDNKSCLIATRIGEVCNPLISKCASPFAICAGKCKCLDAFVATSDGRCRLPDVSFLGGECGRIQCAYPSTCVNGVCKCAGQYRNMTSEEFWIDPTLSSECRLKSFSLHKCNGEYIAAPPGISTPAPSVIDPETSTYDFGNNSSDTSKRLWHTLELQSVLIPAVVASVLFINLIGLSIVCMCKRKQQLRSRPSSTKTYITDVDDGSFKIPRPNITNCNGDKDWKSYTKDDWANINGCRNCNPYVNSIHTSPEETITAYDEVEPKTQHCSECSVCY